MDERFRSAVMVSADSPEEIRPSDVDRVMDTALDMGVDKTEFTTWLLTHDVNARTRKAIEGC